MGQSDPTDVGTSLKWDRGYTKTGLSPGASFEFTGPRENVPNICPLEGMLTQRLGLEPQPVAYLSKRLNQTDKERLTSLPLKPCSDWSPHRRCLKNLSWGYANYFLPAIKWNNFWMGNAICEYCAHQDPGERSYDPTRDQARLACEGPGVSSRGMARQ